MFEHFVKDLLMFSSVWKKISGMKWVHNQQIQEKCCHLLTFNKFFTIALVFIPVLSIFRPDLISSEWKDNDRVLDGTKTVNSFQTLCIDDIAVFGIQHDFVE